MTDDDPEASPPWLPGVPARDLSDAEALEYGIELASDPGVSTSDLYTYVADEVDKVEMVTRDR